MTIYTSDLHLWRIDNWSVLPNCPSGCSFSIWVSPKFLEVAMEIKYEEKAFQDRAREIIKGAGFKYVDNINFLKFGESGLMSFNVPGDNCKLDIERGKWFSSNNVDTVLQQSTLMAIWLMWANFVEGEIWQRRLKEKTAVAV